MDAISLSTLIITAATALTGVIAALHLRKVKLCCCIQSECSTKSPPPTPAIIEQPPIKHTEI